MKKTFAAALLLLVFTFSLFAGEAPFDRVKVSESLILTEEEIQQIIDIQVSETSPNSGYFSFDNYATESSGSFRAVFYMSYGSRSFYADYSFPVFGNKPDIDARFGIRGSYSNSEVPGGLFTLKSGSLSGTVYMSAIISRTPSRDINAILSSTYSATSTGVDDVKFPTESIVSGRLGVNAAFILEKMSVSASLGASAGSQLGGNPPEFRCNFSLTITPPAVRT